MRACPCIRMECIQMHASHANESERNARPTKGSMDFCTDSLAAARLTERAELAVGDDRLRAHCLQQHRLHLFSRRNTWQVSQSIQQEASIAIQCSPLHRSHWQGLPLLLPKRHCTCCLMTASCTCASTPGVEQRSRAVHTCSMPAHTTCRSRPGTALTGAPARHDNSVIFIQRPSCYNCKSEGPWTWPPTLPILPAASSRRPVKVGGRSAGLPGTDMHAALSIEHMSWSAHIHACAFTLHDLHHAHSGCALIRPSSQYVRAPVLWEAATMSQSSASLRCSTSVARSATSCPVARPATASSTCAMT